MKIFIENSQDLIIYVKHLQSSNYELSEGIKYFYNHEKIKDVMVAKVTIGNCTFLDQSFFLIAKDKVYFDYLLSIEVEPRHLIGTGIKAQVASKAYDIRNFGWKHFLEQEGWTVSEFKCVKIDGHGTLFDYFVQGSFDFMKTYYVGEEVVENQVRKMVLMEKQQQKN